MHFRHLLLGFNQYAFQAKNGIDLDRSVFALCRAPKRVGSVAARDLKENQTSAMSTMKKAKAKS